MNKKLISVVELPEFQKFVKHNLNEKECFEIINYIATNPEQGDIIKGTGGIRKLRFALSSNNKGKSGGARVIYFYYNENIPVFLITGFIKSELENISSDSCNKLKKLSEELVKLYIGGGRNE
ncbi:MAG TPA: type II toxin-antitoxin system RelE/ParE family toxin [Rickettsia endosymbiont of Pyrocoelia pectoralis]|nr:type II toxin-antitoxin system RelE/ParE family toxin [Rickettsia endosymbiont of Pyrocoelia pectoralis]